MAKSSGCTIYGGLGRLLWCFRSMLVTHIHIKQHCKYIQFPLLTSLVLKFVTPANNNFVPSAAYSDFIGFCSHGVSNSPTHTVTQLPSCTSCSLNFRFTFESRCDGQWQAPSSLVVCSLAVCQSRHLWATELLALITKTTCEQKGLCSFKSWSHQTSVRISLFEICYHGNVKCAHASSARWLGLNQRFIHFCRKNNTHVHFLAVLMTHGYLRAINIWISHVIVTLTVTQKRRHRHLCDFMLLSFITGYKKNKTIDSFPLFFPTLVYSVKKHVDGLKQV